MDLIQAHQHSKNNKTEILNSHVCGCFHCKKIFTPNEIKNWLNDKKDQTALCPSCQIDAVVGDASGFEITEIFLNDMNKKWF